jgi:transcriptional regulator with XRE-family HTH domain
MDDQAAFGRNIRAARESRNISRELAAERAGITASYLGEIERGEKWPTLGIIRSIARGLNISPGRFFEFEDDQAEAGPLIEQFQRALDNRAPEEQQRALRVIRALFGF